MIKKKPAKRPASKKKPAKRAAAAKRKPAKKAKPATAKRRPPKKAKPAAAKRKKPVKKAAKPAKKAQSRKPAPPKRPPGKRPPAAPAPKPKGNLQDIIDGMVKEGPPSASVYMSVGQKKWFRKLLEVMLVEIRSEAERTNQELLMQEKGLADELDRAHSEYRFVVDLRENERINNLQGKINHSLRLLESGEYGVCEDCGVQIGIRRMAARPVATKCIDCKGFQEDLEKNTL